MLNLKCIRARTGFLLIYKDKMPSNYQTAISANDWKPIWPSTEKYDDRATQTDRQIITPLGNL